MPAVAENETYRFVIQSRWLQSTCPSVARSEPVKTLNIPPSAVALYSTASMKTTVEVVGAQDHQTEPDQDDAKQQPQSGSSLSIVALTSVPLKPVEFPGSTMALVKWSFGGACPKHTANGPQQSKQSQPVLRNFGAPEAAPT